MNLRKESDEIIQRLQSSRANREGWESSFSYYSRWWNLSGIEDVGIMPSDSPFKYVLQTSPFDFWKATMKPETLTSNDPDSYYNEYQDDEINKMVDSIIKVISIVEEEEPHTVAFTSIPTPCGDTFELVGLAKISNNGTSYVFSNDIDYIKYLKKKGL